MEEEQTHKTRDANRLRHTNTRTKGQLCKQLRDELTTA